MARTMVFGYLESFAGVSFVTGLVRPLESRLNSGQAAKIITLVDGRAFNLNETTNKANAQIQYPVEQRLRIIIRSAGGGRAAVDTALATIEAKHGVQGTLSIRSGGSLTCMAVLDEIIEESDMDKTDNGGITYGTFTLVFQQLTGWA